MVLLSSRDEPLPIRREAHGSDGAVVAIGDADQLDTLSPSTIPDADVRLGSALGVHLGRPRAQVEHLGGCQGWEDGWDGRAWVWNKRHRRRWKDRKTSLVASCMLSCSVCMHSWPPSGLFTHTLLYPVIHFLTPIIHILSPIIHGHSFVTPKLQMPS